MGREVQRVESANKKREKGLKSFHIHSDKGVKGVRERGNIGCVK